MSKTVKFEVKGVDITNIQIGDIINMDSYSKNSFENNTWEYIDCSWDKNRDYEVIEITNIDEKYIKLTLRGTVPYISRDGKRSHYSKERIIFNKDGVSKTQYCSSSPGSSWKKVITTIK